MKIIKLEFKKTYEEMVEYIHDNYDIEEPTTFEFTKIVKTNAKMRRLAKFKGVYEYETLGIINLNDNKHKENLFKKVCLPSFGGSYTQNYMSSMGID